MGEPELEAQQTFGCEKIVWCPIATCPHILSCSLECLQLWGSIALSKWLTVRRCLQGSGHSVVLQWPLATSPEPWSYKPFSLHDRSRTESAFCVTAFKYHTSLSCAFFDSGQKHGPCEYVKESMQDWLHCDLGSPENHNITQVRAAVWALQPAGAVCKKTTRESWRLPYGFTSAQINHSWTV